MEQIYVNELQTENELHVKSFRLVNLQKGIELKQHKMLFIHVAK